MGHVTMVTRQFVRPLEVVQVSAISPSVMSNLCSIPLQVM